MSRSVARQTLLMSLKVQDIRAEKQDVPDYLEENPVLYVWVMEVEW